MHANNQEDKKKIKWQATKKAYNPELRKKRSALTLHLFKCIPKVHLKNREHPHTKKLPGEQRQTLPNPPCTSCNTACTEGKEKKKKSSSPAIYIGLMWERVGW